MKMKSWHILLLVAGGIVLLYFFSKRLNGTSTASTTSPSTTSSPSDYSSIVTNLPSSGDTNIPMPSPPPIGFGSVAVHGPAEPIDYNPPSPVVYTYPTFPQIRGPIPLASTVTTTPVVTQVNKPYTSLNIHWQ